MFIKDNYPPIPSLKPATFKINPTEPKYKLENRMWQGCPSIVKTKGGRLFMAYFSGGHKEPGYDNYNVLAYSDDDGETWKDFFFLEADEAHHDHAIDLNLFYAPNGAMYITYMQTRLINHLLPTDQIWAFYDGIFGTWAIKYPDPDGDEITFEEPVRWCDGYPRNQPTVLSTGEWVLTAYDWLPEQFVKTKSFLGRDNSEAKYYYRLYISKDEGKTWERKDGPYKPQLVEFDEPMLLEGKDGQWHYFTRVNKGILHAVSYDRGDTWVDRDPLWLEAGGSRFFVRRLMSGNILLVYSGTGREKMYAKISKDEMESWSEPLVLDDRRNVSYPDGMQDTDGYIYIAYDRERYGAREILWSRFTEEDIEKGGFFGEKSFTKRIMSKVPDENPRFPDKKPENPWLGDNEGYYPPVPSLKQAKVTVRPTDDKYLKRGRKWQGIPSVAKTQDGRIWAVWFSGGEKEPGYGNFIVASFSDDEGKTWNDAYMTVEGDDEHFDRVYDPQIFITPSGELYITYTQCRILSHLNRIDQMWTFYDGVNGVWAMKCKDADAEHPEFEKAVRWCDGTMISKPQFLSTGEWLLTSWDWIPPEFTRTYSLTRDEKYNYSLYISSDCGKSWNKIEGPQKKSLVWFDEPAVIEGKDGKWHFLARTKTGIFYSVSKDRGASWNDISADWLSGADSRFSVTRLNSGKVLLVSSLEGRKGLIARISDDELATFGKPYVIDARADVSYPDAFVDKDGKIYIIYDRERYNAKEILLTSLFENDILNGTPSSKEIINKL